jgi:hypothetical protein
MKLTPTRRFSSCGGSSGSGVSSASGGRTLAHFGTARGEADTGENSAICAEGRSTGRNSCPRSMDGSTRPEAEVEEKAAAQLATSTRHDERIFHCARFRTNGDFLAT